MRNKGFTLIELVIVIVILGILAATAAPKFLDLSGDARESVIKGVEGSINSAADIVHAKALIDGNLAETPAVDDTVSGVVVSFGWPAGTDTGIKAAVELGAETDITVDTTTTAGTAVFSHSGAEGTCQVTYVTSTGVENRPAITTDTSGC